MVRSGLRLKRQRSLSIINVLIVEDHPIVSLGLATVVSAQDDMFVVGRAAQTHEVFDLLDSESAQLVILPLRFEGESKGLEICREIKAMDEAPWVLMYTSFMSTSDATLAFLSGADSFLTKNRSEANLLETIRATVRGNRVWMSGLDAVSTAKDLDDRINSSVLTKRESEVIGFVLQRFSNAEIAGELCISVTTVKSHVSNSFQKLGLRNRRELFSSDDTP